MVRVAGDASPVLVFADGCPALGQEFWISVVPELIEPVQISHEEDGEVVDFPPVAQMVPNALHQAVFPAVE